MKIVRLKVDNFRGIKSTELIFQGNTVLVGDNNSGKSTILEAIDLVLGPERLSKFPVIDEHDFYAGQYLGATNDPIIINVEVVIIDLTVEQQRHFRNHLEWWDQNSNSLIDGPPPESTEKEKVISALRVGFSAYYDEEVDDFSAKTYFLSPTKDEGKFDSFNTKDKRKCGFLFLRTLRTGSRALSLEIGSLLDIIIKLQELHVNMWEDILVQLRKIPVAENPALGIVNILTTVQEAVRTFVPSDWADNPHIFVSDLTRTHLRRVLTVFMGTGAFNKDGAEYSAPFQHQGTGTINTLVLALISFIAELKQNVIFAMEEPEIAIPPHAQKRIIDNITLKSSQALFTSHSPYVLEEFKPSQILVIKRESGVLSGVVAEYPPTIKPKKYRSEIRQRFCESLLARRVLITEGRTEYDAFPAAARRLAELHPEEFQSLEAMGIAIVNAESETQVAPLGHFFRSLGKTVFAVFDKQSATSKAEIEKEVDYPFEATEKGFENIILDETAEPALRRFVQFLIENDEWPSHLNSEKPSITTPLLELKLALEKYLGWSKGKGDAADLLMQCSKAEMPNFITETLTSIQKFAITKAIYVVEDLDEENPKESI